MAKLLLKFHNSVLKEIPLDQEQVWIGRKSDNMVVIDNPAVSAQHARVKEENGAYYLEDLASTNGTFLNDKRVDRELLRDGDQIRVGKHLLVYQDTGHHPERPQDAMPSASDLDKTMVLEAAKPRVLSRASQGERRSERPPGQVGVLQVVAGKTDRPQYHLRGRLTVIGSQRTAAVRLTKWFAPRVAALISRRPEGYFLSPSEGGRKVLINGQPVQGRGQLQDGDLLEVGEVKMRFSFSAPLAKAAE